jgi:hypothetical protein
VFSRKHSNEWRIQDKLDAENRNNEDEEAISLGDTVLLSNKVTKEMHASRSDTVEEETLAVPLANADAGTIGEGCSMEGDDELLSLGNYPELCGEKSPLNASLQEPVPASMQDSLPEEEESMDHEYSDEDSDYDDGESKTNCFLFSRERFQLLGASCTWLSCEIEELSPPSVSEIAYVSDNIYTTEQIKRMERRICKALNVSLSQQTP